MKGPARTRMIRELLSRRAAKRRLAEWGIVAKLPKRRGRSVCVDVPSTKIDARCRIVLIERRARHARERSHRQYRFCYSVPANPLRR